METIKANMADKSWLRRTSALALNRYGLQGGGRLGIQLRGCEELEALARDSLFAEAVSVEMTTLQNLPIFAQITLRKRISAKQWSTGQGIRP
jgi:hypothetical protein